MRTSVGFFMGFPMNYSKPPLTTFQQAELILSRGLEAERSDLVDVLEAISYYRLSGYLYPFRQENDLYVSGATLDKVLKIYSFDQKLLLCCLDAIEKVEVAIRTAIVYRFVHCYGPFGYLDYINLNNLSKEGHIEWLFRIKTETSRSKERFVQHFFRKYGENHEYLPLWMASEIMSFGSILTLYKGMNDDLKKEVAVNYSVPDKVFKSWLISINSVRNICAHHGRLWNRELGYKPLLPSLRKSPEWHTPVSIPNNRVFVILSILKYLVSLIKPESTWSDQLVSFLGENSDIDRSSMGFPEEWTELFLWK